jgi:hypothetical protein
MKKIIPWAVIFFFHLFTAWHKILIPVLKNMAMPMDRNVPTFIMINPLMLPVKPSGTKHT